MIVAAAPIIAAGIIAVLSLSDLVVADIWVGLCR